MDKLANYRNLIKRHLCELATLVNKCRTNSDVETLCVFDEERDQYLLVNVGWTKSKRVWDTTLYVRLKNGKIWVEEDWTEEGIATALVKAGVPNGDIVLAFHAPNMRQFGEFAVT